MLTPYRSGFGFKPVLILEVEVDAQAERFGAFKNQNEGFQTEDGGGAQAQ